MYRILAQQGEVRERRRGHRQTAYAKPELLATAPNQLWSWDITKLKGPVTWSYFYLYVILDVFSRYVVGWLLADRESSTLAEKLIRQACQQQQIQPGQLTLHADRGASMKSKVVAHLLSDLGVTKTHSRPHTSDDNPFSEAQFKTLKYRPGFPERFDSQTRAHTFCRDFFLWYNQQHKHSRYRDADASDCALWSGASRAGSTPSSQTGSLSSAPTAVQSTATETSNFTHRGVD